MSVLPVDWKAEAELLRAQLVQCTTAMRNAVTRLEDTNLSSAGDMEGSIRIVIRELSQARGQAIDPYSFAQEYEQKINRLEQQLSDCDRNREQEMSVHIATERRIATDRDSFKKLYNEQLELYQNLLAKHAETDWHKRNAENWEQAYRKLAVENAALLSQLWEADKK